MDNSLLEDLSVSAVTTRIVKLGFIKPFINSNDKTPLWDGDLYIYNNSENFNNETFSFRVPIQIKSTELKKKQEFPDSTQHRIKKTELNHFFNDGGVVYFKVLVINGETEVYYRVLTKKDVQNLIKDSKNKSDNVKLKKFNCSYFDFLCELRSLYLQLRFESKELSSIGKETYSITIDSLPNQGDPFEFLATHHTNLLLECSSQPGRQYYVAEGPSKLFFSRDKEVSISINGEEYFSSCKIEYTEKGKKLIVGNCFSILIPYDNNTELKNTVNIEYNPKTLNEAIGKLKFLIPLLTYKKIKFDTLELTLPDKEVFKEILPSWKNILRLYVAFKQFLSTIFVTDEFIIDNLSDSDRLTIDLLLGGYHKNIAVQSPLPMNDGKVFEVSNLYIYFMSKHIRANIYQLFDINDTEYVVLYTDNDGTQYPISIYTYAFMQPVFPSNINFEGVLPSYQKVFEQNSKCEEIIVLDILNLITHFDASKNFKILNLALSIAEWLKSVSNTTPEIMLYNVLQIKKRLKINLTDEEVKALFDIKESTSNLQYKLACYILLEEKTSALLTWDKLNEEDKELIKGWPIYLLYENLINNNNG